MSMIEGGNAAAWKDTLCANAYVTRERLDIVVTCALCDKPVWLSDTWSPAADAICSECDTEVTERRHPPSLDPAVDLSPVAAKMIADAKQTITPHD